MSIKDEKISECKAALNVATLADKRARAEYILAEAAYKAGASYGVLDSAISESQHASRQLRIAQARYEAALKLP